MAPVLMRYSYLPALRWRAAPASKQYQVLAQRAAPGTVGPHADGARLRACPSLPGGASPALIAAAASRARTCPQGAGLVTFTTAG